MSDFSNYKNYRTYLPQYSNWKKNIDTQNAKREEYLKINSLKPTREDIGKSKALIRAIDVMDEYSQQNAENMEVLTESVVAQVISIISGIFGGTALLMLGKSKKINAAIDKIILKIVPELKEIAKKNNNALLEPRSLILMTLGLVPIITAASFPLYSWAAKAEVNASRQGRFNAMKEELNNPNLFAILTPEQENQVNENLKNVKISSKKPKSKDLYNNKNGFFKMIKHITHLRSEKEERNDFIKSLDYEKQFYDKNLAENELDDAKRDQQILLKLVEKIDIASQDYAENTELATATVSSIILGSGPILSYLLTMVSKKFNIKISKYILAFPTLVSILSTFVLSILSADVQKQASRVGRHMIKQELLKSPEKLTYVEDEKTKDIKDVIIQEEKKDNIFKFLLKAIKNNNEYKKWLKNEGEREKATIKELKKINLSPEQLKDAKRLQKNTFKTFNTLDDKTQQYSESIEALGSAIQYPIVEIFSLMGMLWGLRNMVRLTQKNANILEEFTKMFAKIFATTLPAIGINAYITKEQKKASRVASMLAINELSDVKNFADYSDYYEKNVK